MNQAHVPLANELAVDARRWPAVEALTSIVECLRFFWVRGCGSECLRISAATRQRRSPGYRSSRNTARSATGAVLRSYGPVKSTPGRSRANTSRSGSRAASELVGASRRALNQGLSSAEREAAHSRAGDSSWRYTAGQRAARDGGAPDRRCEAIAAMAGEGLPVQVAERVFEVSGSGHHDFRNRGPSPPKGAHARLTDVIRAVHLASRGTCGYRRSTPNSPWAAGGQALGMAHRLPPSTRRHDLPLRAGSAGRLLGLHRPSQGLRLLPRWAGSGTASTISCPKRPGRDAGRAARPAAVAEPDRTGQRIEYLEIWHNRRRRHSALGRLSPMEFESDKVPCRGFQNLSPQILGVPHVLTATLGAVGVRRSSPRRRCNWSGSRGYSATRPSCSPPGFTSRSGSARADARGYVGRSKGSVLPVHGGSK